MVNKTFVTEDQLKVFVQESYNELYDWLIMEEIYDADTHSFS